MIFGKLKSRLKAIEERLDDVEGADAQRKLNGEMDKLNGEMDKTLKEQSKRIESNNQRIVKNKKHIEGLQERLP